MNQTKAKQVLKVYGRPAFKVKGSNNTIVFARQHIEDIEEIEKMKDSELVSEWKGLVWTNHIYGQVSLNEMQRIDLIELEMDGRKGINKEEMTAWYKKAEENFDKKQEEL